MKTGSCLCGAVAYEILGPMKNSLACHCSQCRKQTGSYWISSSLDDSHLKITKTDGLKWFSSSANAKRGFCKECGSNLFWKENGSVTTSVCLGGIDGKSDVKFNGHIFCDDAGDYYEIVGGSFQKP